MKSLTALINEAAVDEPLAQALEAILDSGLIIFSRDTEGHFVQLSEQLTEPAGIIAGSGHSQPRNLRVFDETDRLLPGSIPSVDHSPDRLVASTDSTGSSRTTIGISGSR